MSSPTGGTDTSVCDVKLTVCQTTRGDRVSVATRFLSSGYYCELRAALTSLLDVRQGFVFCSLAQSEGQTHVVAGDVFAMIAARTGMGANTANTISAYSTDALSMLPLNSHVPFREECFCR